MMYGQMTAVPGYTSVLQGIKGTYETFEECGRQHFNGNFKRKITGKPLALVEWWKVYNH